MQLLLTRTFYDVIVRLEEREASQELKNWNVDQAVITIMVMGKF